MTASYINLISRSHLRVHEDKQGTVVSEEPTQRGRSQRIEASFLETFLKTKMCHMQNSLGKHGGCHKRTTLWYFLSTNFMRWIWCLKLWSSGLWHRIVWWVGINILEEHIASIFYPDDGYSYVTHIPGYMVTYPIRPNYEFSQQTKLPFS